MVKRITLAGVTFLLLLGLLLPAGAAAEVVGRLTQLEGRVDLLRGGQLPATPAKLQDGVEPGDVLRTKTLSRAQVTFIDNSVVTVSPESRILIEEYLFDAAKGKRRAVLELFQGLAHAVINKVFKVEEPDFVVKTHTAVLGVRGTELGFRIHPNHTMIMNFKGLSRASNRYPEVRGFVDLKDNQGTLVGRNLPPTIAFELGPEDHKHFMSNLATGLLGKKGGKDAGAGAATGAAGPGAAAAAGADPGTGGSGTSGTGLVVAATTDPALGSTFTTGLDTVLGTGSSGPVGGPSIGSGSDPTVSLPPVQPPSPSPPPPPSVATYTFTSYSYGFWGQTTASGNPTDTAINVTGSGWSERTGTWSISGSSAFKPRASAVEYSFPQYYITESSGTRNLTTPVGNNVYGTYTATMTGSVSGTPGQNLTGTVNYTSVNSFGNTVTWSAPVTIKPDGTMTYSYTGGIIGGNSTGTATGSGTAKPGVYFSQTAADISISNTSSSPYSSATHTSTYPIYGTGTSTSGTSYNLQASLTATEKNPNPAYNLPSNTFMPTDQGDFSASFRGVVDPATGKGTMTTETGATKSGPTMLAGPVTVDTSGNLTATFYGTTMGGDNRYRSIEGTWVQSPVTSLPAPSTYSFNQTYNGSMGLNVAGSSASSWGFGWGERTGVVYPGYFLGYEQGSNWQLASGSFPNVPGNFRFTGSMAGNAYGVLGNKTMTGQMTFTGSAANGLSFSFTGPVTVYPNGEVTFNYQNGGGSSSTWTYSSGGSTLGSGTAAGAFRQQPGSYFEQTASGNYNLTSSGGTKAIFSGNFTGSRTVFTPSNFTGSYLTQMQAALPVFPSTDSGTISVTTRGVMAGDPSVPAGSGKVGGLWGAATSTTTLSGGSLLPITDTRTGNLMGNPNQTFLQTAEFNLGGVLTSVMSVSAQAHGPGQSTGAFVTNASGSYSMATSAGGDAATVTTPTALTATTDKIGSVPTFTQAGLTLTSATQPPVAGTYPASHTGTGQMNLIGAVAGPTAGDKAAVVMGVAQTTNPPPFMNYSTGLGGSGILNNATSQLPVSIQGMSPAPNGATASQTGTVTLK